MVKILPKYPKLHYLNCLGCWSALQKDSQPFEAECIFFIEFICRIVYFGKLNANSIISHLIKSSELIRSGNHKQIDFRNRNWKLDHQRRCRQKRAKKSARIQYLPSLCFRCRNQWYWLPRNSHQIDLADPLERTKSNRDLAFRVLLANS